MKLLPATSFFFCSLLFLLLSCESNDTYDQGTTSSLSILKEKISQKEKEKKKDYDSIIYNYHKLLEASLAENNKVFVKHSYNKLSRIYSSLKKYDSAIFYSHKLLKVGLMDENDYLIKKAYNKLSLYHSRSKSYDSAIFYSEKLHTIAVLTNDTVSIAKAYYKKGLYYKNIDSLQLSYKNYLESQNLYIKIGDTIEAGKILLNSANIQKALGGFSSSQLSALDGLTYLESSNDYKSISGLHHILSVVLKENGEYETALEENSIALKFASDTTDNKIKATKSDIIKYKNTKANIFKDQGKYDKAIVIYKTLLSEEQQNKKIDTLEIARIESNLGFALYLKDGYNNISDSLLNKALAVLEAKENISGLNATYINLTVLYSKNNPRKSLMFANMALANAKKRNNLKTLKDVWEVKFKTQNDIGVEDRNQYLLAKADFEKQQNKVNLLFVKKKFDFEKSENKRKATEKAKIISDKKVAQRTNQVLILILILIISIVITYFIYQKIKHRHKIEKVKTVHTTEARISSKVHDELANDVYKLMTQLETSEPDREIVLDKLDAIYNNARDISKQIQSVDTGKGFSDELNNLLRSYQSDTVNVLLKRYETEIWKDISSHIKTTIYRVLQELLTNMKKHSEAALVVVSIEKQHKKLFIQYIDNGKGFSEGISKNGLQNAENRIHSIQGSLTFDTELLKGCKFSINVPV
jgi:hypothetical protein